MILDRLGKELIYFDGGTGTLLQERGIKTGRIARNMEPGTCR